MFLDHEARHCLVILGDSLAPWSEILPWCPTADTILKKTSFRCWSSIMKIVESCADSQKDASKKKGKMKGKRFARMISMTAADAHAQTRSPTVAPADRVAPLSPGKGHGIQEQAADVAVCSASWELSVAGGELRDDGFMAAWIFWMAFSVCQGARDDSQYCSAFWARKHVVSLWLASFRQLKSLSGYPSSAH